MFNEKGLQFLKARTTNMAVDSMEKAEEVIHRKIVERDKRIAAGKPLPTDTTPAFACGLAWVIGFDHLIDDRKAIHHIVDKLS